MKHYVVIDRDFYDVFVVELFGKRQEIVLYPHVRNVYPSRELAVKVAVKLMQTRIDMIKLSMKNLKSLV